jgi:hypothetical protein
MADEQQQEPPVAPELDPVGAEVDARIASTDALVRGLKYSYGQEVLLAQEGDGEAPPPGGLAALQKLEVQLQNLRLFAGARRLTRRSRAAT